MQSPFYATIPLAAAELEFSGRLVAPNPRMKQLCGLPDDGGDLIDLLAIPEDWEWLSSSLKNQKDECDVLIMLTRANGHPFMAQVSVTTSPVNRDQKILWIDESQHIQTTSASLKCFFDLTPQPLLVCHPITAQIMKMNKAAGTFFGFDPEKRETWKNLDELVKQATRKALFHKLTETPSIDNNRLMVMTSSMTKVPASVSARRIELDTGHCVLLGFTTNMGKLIEDEKSTKSEIISNEIAEPLLNATPIPMLACRLNDGGISRVNVQAARLLQSSRSDLERGKANLADFLGEEKCRDLLNKIRLDGEANHFKATFVTKNGFSFDGHISARRVQIQKHAYAVISVSETPVLQTTNYQEFFDTAPLPMILVHGDDTALIKRMNHKAKDLFLADPSTSLANLKLKDLIGLRTQHFLKKLLKTNEHIENFDAKLNSSCENNISCQLSAKKIKLDEEDLLLICVDSFAERQKSKQTLDQFFNAAPLPMVLSKVDTRQILRINQRASELFARSDDFKNLDLRLDQLLGEKETKQFLEKLKTGGFVDDLEINIETPYGQELWGLISGQLIRLDGQDCVITGINDITDRKHVEEALKVSREQAVKATKQKSAFLSTMSHEIRTPMTGILGMLELLHMGELDTQQEEAVSVVKDSATALLTIVDDILDFSKIESGRLKLENIPFCIRENVENTLDLMGARARSKGIELIARIDRAVPEQITGDPTRINQVLLNLIGNAIKFTKDGHIVVRAKQVLKGNNQPFMRFEVEDNGIGISPEKQKLLFKPFSQTDSSTSRFFGGTGLGLSICKALTELMGGEIGVNSQEGAGATFWFDVAYEANTCIPRNIPEQNLAGLTLLILQQHPETLEGYSNILSSRGATVLSAQNLDDAIEQSKACLPDIAILDHSQNGMCGFSSLDRLNDQIYLSPKQAILTQSLFTETTSLDPRFKEIAARLPKPVRPNILIREILEISGRQKSGPHNKKRLHNVQMTREEALTKGQLILLAEDNPTNQLVVGKQLAKLGYAFDIAENGKVALDKLETTDYGLLLTDCRMPEMNGYQLTLSIRAQEQKRKGSERLPIIALTANASTEDADACLSSGMDAYLTKPIKFDTLREELDKWLPISSDLCCEEIPEETEFKGDQDTSALTPIDLSKLEEILGMADHDLFLDILSFFVETIDELMHDLDRAIRKEDLSAISNYAHAAKGASRNAAAISLGDRLEILEKTVHQMSHNEIAALHSEVVNDVEKVKKYVTQLGSPNQ